MRASIRGLRAELALRLDPHDSAGEGVCGAEGGEGCDAELTLPLALRLPVPDGLPRVVEMPVRVPRRMSGAEAPRRLREGLRAAVMRAELEGELSVEDLERLHDTLLQMYLEHLDTHGNASERARSPPTEGGGGSDTPR